MCINTNIRVRAWIYIYIYIHTHTPHIHTHTHTYIHILIHTCIPETSYRGADQDLGGELQPDAWSIFPNDYYIHTSNICTNPHLKISDGWAGRELNGVDLTQWWVLPDGHEAFVVSHIHLRALNFETCRVVSRYFRRFGSATNHPKYVYVYMYVCVRVCMCVFVASINLRAFNFWNLRRNFEIPQMLWAWNNPVYACVCVWCISCMYTYTYIHIISYIYIYIFIIYIFIYIMYVYKYMHICMWILCDLILLLAWRRSVYTYSHTFTYICAHVYTHTHKNRHRPSTSRCCRGPLK